jgi:hypothetical protein
MSNRRRSNLLLRQQKFGALVEIAAPPGQNGAPPRSIGGDIADTEIYLVQRRFRSYWLGERLRAEESPRKPSSRCPEEYSKCAGRTLRLVTRETHASAPRPHQRAIADRKNVGIASSQKRRVTTSWPIRLVSRPKRLRTSGPFTPAHQITSSEGMKPPSASCTPSNPLTSGSKAAGRFGKQDFVYIPEEDAYRCPADQRLTWRFTSAEKGMTPATGRASALGVR